ncbi:MAG TPA: hypothetical protein VIX82_18500 [Solirubrobacteraceae bacterium]
MDDRARCAAANNAEWCDLVCRSQGIRTAMQPGLWVALERSPELYPDAVTLLPSVAAEEVLAAVQDGPGCSVKDSFATLDLDRLGFDELFQAQWIFHEPATAGQKSALIWSVIETDEDLAEWVRAAELADTIRSELLLDSSVRILAARGPDGLIAGAAANRTGSVVGVSNVFTTDVAIDEVWAGIADAVATVFPSLSLVGYDRGEHLQAALAGGFIAIGPLRIWLRLGAPA